MLKLPNGLVICASSLLCAAVVALQQAEPYAARLEAPAQVLSDLMLRMPSALRSAGSLTLATKLNMAEKSRLASLAALVSPENPMGEEPAELTSSAELAPEEEPAAVATEPAPEEEPAAVATEPAPVEEPATVAAEPVPEEAPAAVAAEPVPVEAPAAIAAEPVPAELSAEPAETISLVSSQWRELLALSTTATRQVRPLFPAGLRPAVAEASPAAPAEVQPAELASAEPAPVENEPQPAEPTPAAPLPPAAELLSVPVSAEQPTLTQAPPMRCRIMMVGDSLMEDLGPLTHRTFNRRKGLDFVVSAKFSTGLCRPDFFNWPAHMREVIAKRKPDLVIFFIGANDGLSIKEGKRLVPTGGEAWRAAYCRKMDEVVGIAQEAGAAVIWVELPAIGGRYNKLLHETQKAQREYCESHSLISLRTDPLLSGEWGKFTLFGEYKGKTVRLRRNDDTHLTPEGNRKVLDALLPIVEQQLISFYLAHPERHLSEAEAAKIKSVPAIYTCQYTPVSKKKAADTPQPAAPAPARP